MRWILIERGPVQSSTHLAPVDFSTVTNTDSEPHVIRIPSPTFLTIRNAISDSLSLAYRMEAA